MRKLSRIITAALLTTSVVVGPLGGPASAADVAVHFQVSVGTAAPPAVPISECSVSVPAGADGVAVLDAAEREGCIDSYEGSNDPQFGFFLECVNGLCETPVTYWAFYENNDLASYGLGSFTAEAGDEVEVSYQTWLPCLTPAGCDPVPHDG